MGYPLIDVLRTGQRLKEACIKKNIEAKEIKQLPEIFPDYIGVTVPVNIAPLNFNMTDDDVDEMFVSVAGSKTVEEISSFGKEYADFDVEEWHDFLRKNKGGKLTVSVFVLKNGERFKY